MGTWFRMPIKRERWPDETYVVTIQRDKKTNVVVNEWWMQGQKMHREHGPACTSRDPITGTVISEKWFRNGRLHREDGPADILRKPDGRIYYSAWYRDDIKIRPAIPVRRDRKAPDRPRPPPTP
jgi:hypothetical protein